jgi:monovalent cation:H+ antiporter-2, CPA2 family
MHIPLLQDVVIIIGLAILVSFLFNLIRIPPIIGFLLTGILAGPHGFGIIKVVNEVEIMAEIGVVLLLFIIGLEFSVQKLLKIKKIVLIGGTSQVLLSIAGVTAIGYYYGLSIPNSVFAGFLVSLSSTAIILKLLQEKSELDSPHGRTTFGILVFQDVIVVPMMIITPLLAGAYTSNDQSIADFIIKIVIFLVVIITLAKWIIPMVLHQVARLRNREMFLLTVVFIVFSVAWFTSELGLSLALGAFLAGVIVSESEYSQAAISNLLPFHDLFMSFFFVSIGMLLNVKFFIANIFIVLILAAGLILLKFFIAALATIFLRFPLRTALITGISLAQIGEFSFILSDVGREFELIGPDVYQIFLSVVVITMIATPFIYALRYQIAGLVKIIPLPNTIKNGTSIKKGKTPAQTKNNHLIIVGFGHSGRLLSKAAVSAGLDYNIVDLNPDTVRLELKAGEPIMYGDATQGKVLQKAGIDKARILVIVSNDAIANVHTVRLARQINPNIYIIARSRYFRGSEELNISGADEVMIEEAESAISIFSSVLSHYGVNQDQITRLCERIKTNKAAHTA